MTDQEMIDAALQAIGVGAKGDYKIQPTVHATELASKAPTLAAILNRAQFSVLAEEYERKDQEAIKAQESSGGIVIRIITTSRAATRSRTTARSIT